MEGQYHEGIGRRKTSTARVRLYEGGTGVMTINEKPAEQYFTREIDRATVWAPLKVIGGEASFNVSVHVIGGGITGQADAVQMGLARALLKARPESHAALRQNQLLTRDPRAKERKKPGLKRSRKAPQYTKR